MVDGLGDWGNEIGLSAQKGSQVGLQVARECRRKLVEASCERIAEAWAGALGGRRAEGNALRAVVLVKSVYRNCDAVLHTGVFKGLDTQVEKVACHFPVFWNWVEA